MILAPSCPRIASGVPSNPGGKICSLGSSLAGATVCSSDGAEETPDPLPLDVSEGLMEEVRDEEAKAKLLVNPDEVSTDSEVDPLLAAGAASVLDASKRKCRKRELNIASETANPSIRKKRDGIYILCPYLEGYGISYYYLVP